MAKPEYLKSYSFRWEAFDIIAGGISSLDAENYLHDYQLDSDGHGFLQGYGFDSHDPIQKAELFGIFQEAIQFIKRYFLIEGNSEGYVYQIPNIFYTLTEVAELLSMTTGHFAGKRVPKKDQIWAGIILKVMHTILHADKDLRYHYFNVIQTQIFDRFYRHLHRDEKDQLFYTCVEKETMIPLVSFETKAKKTRESIIIKLLHKKENVAEELFDRIGVRFITDNKVDALRVLKQLYLNHTIIINNIKPSRSKNTLVDLEKFKKESYQLLKEALKSNLSEDAFAAKLEKIADNCPVMSEHDKNEHSLEEYRAIHFTCRQLIKYRNPFLTQFNELKKMAKTQEGSELAQKVLQLDTSTIAKDIRFFYPYEVQVTDRESHKNNTRGEASHHDYKKAQLKSAMDRLFAPLVALDRQEKA